MCKEDVNEIKEFLKGKIGEDKGLSDWCQEINGMKLIRKRLTTRELAFIFNRSLKDNDFTIERSSDPVRYRFVQQVSISQ